MTDTATTPKETKGKRHKSRALVDSKVYLSRVQSVKQAIEHDPELTPTGLRVGRYLCRLWFGAESQGLQYCHPSIADIVRDLGNDGLKISDRTAKRATRQLKELGYLTRSRGANKPNGKDQGPRATRYRPEYQYRRGARGDATDERGSPTTMGGILDQKEADDARESLLDEYKLPQMAKLSGWKRASCAKVKALGAFVEKLNDQNQDWDEEVWKRLDLAGIWDTISETGERPISASEAKRDADELRFDLRKGFPLPGFQDLPDWWEAPEARLWGLHRELIKLCRVDPERRGETDPAYHKKDDAAYWKPRIGHLEDFVELAGLWHSISDNGEIRKPAEAQ